MSLLIRLLVMKWEGNKASGSYRNMIPPWTINLLRREGMHMELMVSNT